MSGMENPLDEINTGLYNAEENINELEDTVIETNQNKSKRKNNLTKMNRAGHLSGTVGVSVCFPLGS